MTTKLVLRLLEASGALLGWCEVQAKARGDGQLWSPGPVTLTPDRAGEAAVLSIHWCEVNVETRVPCAAVVTAGRSLVLYEQAAPLVVVGPAAQGLPNVSLRRAARVEVPVGQLGACG